MEAGPRCGQEEAVEKRLAWSPQPILGGNQVLVVQAQRDAVSKGAQQRENPEKEEKGPKIREKQKIHPNSQTVSQQGSVGPSVSDAGGSERQVADLEMRVAATRSEMVSGRPSRNAGVSAENTAFPIGPAGEPLEMRPGARPIELQRVGISSVVRLRGTVVELRARV